MGLEVDVKSTPNTEEIAMRWIRSSCRVYKTGGFIHEKLNVAEFGAYGGGGEYKPHVTLFFIRALFFNYFKLVSFSGV